MPESSKNATIEAWARFTHLAREKDSRRILRGGIKAGALDGGMVGVYAMPVLPSFFASHQWLRELRRWRSSPLVAVDFVIDDDELVRVGHFSAAHAPMTAAVASAVILHAEDSRGYEVVIPRAITAKEISGVRQVPQVVGWRYWPEAHGTPPCSWSGVPAGDVRRGADSPNRDIAQPLRRSLPRARRAGDGQEEEPAPHEVFGREEERVLAETLWSRLRPCIGEPALDL